jgi:hypothetical protein
MLLLVVFVSGESGALFPFMAPQTMKTKHELQEGATYSHYQHYCFGFIYAVVGKPDVKVIHDLPGIVGPLCRVSKSECSTLVNSMIFAVQQKTKGVNGRPYADWCEQVYNHIHPTPTTMPQYMDGHAHPALSTHVKPLLHKAKAAQLRIVSAAAGLFDGGVDTHVRPTTSPLLREELKEAAKDVGHFGEHLAADFAGHAIADKAAELNNARKLEGADDAFASAFAAVNKLESTDGNAHVRKYHHHHR